MKQERINQLNSNKNIIQNIIEQMRDYKEYSWNKYLIDDDDDPKSQRYPVIREKAGKNYLNSTELNSPITRKRIQSTSNNIQYKSQNNLGIIDRVNLAKQEENPKNQLLQIKPPNPQVINKQIPILKIVPDEKKNSKEVIIKHYQIMKKQKINPIPIQQKPQINEMDTDLEAFKTEIKVNSPESKRILVLQNKLAQAQFKIKSLEKFQKQKQNLYNERMSFQKLFEESLASNEKIEEQMKQMCKINKIIQQQNETLKKKYQALQQSLKKNKNDNKLMEDQKAKNMTNTKQIEKLKQALKKTKQENQLLMSVKLSNSINLQKLKKLCQQKTQNASKLEEQLKQKTAVEQKLKRQLEMAKNKVLITQKQTQQWKKKLNQLQKQVKELMEDKKVMEKRQLENIGLCKYCLERKAKFVNIQCGHVNVCEICVKHQVCLQACMTCKAKGEYKQIFCSLLRSQ